MLVPTGCRALRTASITLVLCTGLCASELAFEVASIRPSPPLDGSHGPIYVGPKGGPGTEDPGRYWCSFCDVSGLISQAYDVPEYRIFSAYRLPDNRFHIAATLSPETTREQFRVMLQNLLADRFKLSLHHESREMRMYRLVVSPGGPKLKAHVEGGASKTENPQEIRKRPAGFYYKAQGKTMADFVKVVEGQLGKPVTDATGLNEKYDFDIWWTADLNADAATDLPTIYTAIQSLGLKLDMHKGNVDVIVIDHMQRLPTEN